jgi:hypothetical protein
MMNRILYATVVFTSSIVYGLSGMDTGFKNRPTKRILSMVKFCQTATQNVEHGRGTPAQIEVAAKFTRYLYEKGYFNLLHQTENRLYNVSIKVQHRHAKVGHNPVRCGQPPMPKQAAKKLF